MEKEKCTYVTKKMVDRISKHQSLFNFSKTELFLLVKVLKNELENRGCRMDLKEVFNLNAELFLSDYLCPKQK